MHISHILSARLSFKPLEWNILYADQMVRLRVHRINGGDIYETIVRKTAEKKAEKRNVELDRRIVKSKLYKKVAEKIDNKTILNFNIYFKG